MDTLKIVQSYLQEQYNTDRISHTIEIEDSYTIKIISDTSIFFMCQRKNNHNIIDLWHIGKHEVQWHHLVAIDLARPDSLEELGRYVKLNDK